MLLIGESVIILVKYHDYFKQLKIAFQKWVNTNHFPI